MKAFLPFLFAALLIGEQGARAADVWAADASLSAVTTAYNACVDGDTLRIPADTKDWDGNLTVAGKWLTIKGAGAGQTIIRDHWSGGTEILRIRVPDGKTNRLIGVEFQYNGGATKFNGILDFRADVTNFNTGTRMEIESCRFDFSTASSAAPIYCFWRNLFGVVHFCEFSMRQGSSIGLYIYNDDWKGNGKADVSYHDPSNFGSDQFLFIEDNYIHRDLGRFYAFTDAYRGARYVVRSNRVTSCWMEMHGTDSGQRQRGTRAVEIYNNEWFFNGAIGNEATGYLVNQRSGVSVVYSNTYTEPTSTKWRMVMDAYRRFYQFTPWGPGNGVDPADINDPANPYVTGIATGGGSLSLTDSGKNWTPNQWVGYTLRRTSPLWSGGWDYSYILANTATTLTVEQNNGYWHGSPAEITFANGDHYEINKVIYFQDQPGRAQGGQLTSADPPACYPAGWNDQVNEVCYQWENRWKGNLINWEPQCVQIVGGVHFSNNVAKPGYTPFPYPYGTAGGGNPPPPQRPANLKITRVLVK